MHGNAALRVESSHDPKELVVDDLAFEAEPLGALAVPDAFRFAGVEVVRRERLDVVGAGIGAFERGDAGGHRRHLPVISRHLPARPVHSSVSFGVGGRVVVDSCMGVSVEWEYELVGVGDCLVASLRSWWFRFGWCGLRFCCGW